MRQRRGEYIVQRADQLRALRSPLRQEIVDTVVSKGPTSVAKLAQILGRAPDSLYYHVRLLQRVELLVSAERRHTGVRFEEVVDVPGRPVSLATRSHVPTHRRAVQEIVSSLLRLTARQHAAALRRGEGSKPRRPRTEWAARVTGWLSATEVAGLMRTLERMSRVVQRRKRGDRRRLYALTFVAAPIDESAPRRRQSRRGHTRARAGIGAAAIILFALSKSALGWAADRPTIRQGYIKSSVSPCDDFYDYANGAWIDTARVRGPFPFASPTLDTYMRNQAVLAGVLDSAAARVNVEHDPTLRKLGALFATLMDSSRADREGLAPLAARLRRIDAIRGPRNLSRLFAEFAAEGDAVPLDLDAEPDPRESRQMVAVLRQGNLGLPDRDYYVRRDPISDSLRVAYRLHVAALLELAGATHDHAVADAARVLTLETALADSSLDPVGLRDPVATYHKLAVRELAALTPGIDWPDFFKAAGIGSMAGSAATVIVEEPSFVRHLGALVRHTPLVSWRAYLRFHSLETAAVWLGGELQSEALGFRAHMVGQSPSGTRRQRAVEAVDAVMGEALGRAFVARTFPPDARASARELVDDLQTAFDARLASLGWMSDSTRVRAREKLSKVVKKIGYPDRWRDYSALAIDPGESGWENLRRARVFEVKRRWDQIGRPVDRGQWEMSPATLNAYYNASRNEIVFPAAFLQAPEFEASADAARNYGAAGAVIGHELTHGFDDQGRRFDADGNLVDWWTLGDEHRFEEHAERVVAEFDRIVAIDTLHINGRLTLGENLADLGGVVIAYDAYEKYLARHGREIVAGFTPEQRFFIAFAQSRLSVYTPELTRMVVLGDPHPPDRWRVNGVVANLPQFHAAFGCRDGDAMVRPLSERATIW